ncbi:MULTISPECIES: YdcF family protein [Gordonia]|uniref:YdcF family protein n=1 Tax=Gordonia tangerina TaxID=2911060 RepID=A0ABS9DLW6_9ACTN|nr:YdcF family protein [Gordonia tangerina]MCF3940157.1 YdcF family protein [Gordonia tangerina]
MAATTVVIICAGIPVFVVPQIDAPRRADAIVVLGGHDHERYPYGLELALSGVAPRVVMSNPAGSKDTWLTDLCSHQRYSFEVTCFTPKPATTQGEAEEIAHLAAEYSWQTVVVVTFRPHISRARYIISRCFDGAIVMAESPSHISLGYWLYSYGYQTAGYLRALVRNGC